MNKRLQIIIFSIIVNFFIYQICSVCKAINHENTVIIIQGQQMDAYNEAIKGFKEGIKGKNISIKAIYDLKGDVEEGKKIIRSIEMDKLNPDLIVTVGILATILTKEHFTKVPILFCMVINNRHYNLHNMNITGISSEAPVEDQFAVINKLIGSKKKIGVIYDPAIMGKIVSEAAHVKGKFGFDLIKKEVTSSRETITALESIINEIDALWILPDNTIIAKDLLSTIGQITSKHRLPVFCTSEAIMNRERLASISIDYTQIGIQAAKIARTLLNNQRGTPVISLGVRNPDKLKITINTQTAERIGVDISYFLNQPDVIFYQ